MEQKVHVQGDQKRNYFFLPISRQRSSHFLGSRASECITVTWKENALTINIPAFFFSFLWAFVAEHNIIWYRILLDHLLQLCPPSLLLTSSTLTGGAEWEKEKALTVQVLFNNSQNTAVLSTLFSHKVKAQHHTGSWEESYFRPRQAWNRWGPAED